MSRLRRNYRVFQRNRSDSAVGSDAKHVGEGPEIPASVATSYDFCNNICQSLTLTSDQL
jgi:hypothetical protein